MVPRKSDGDFGASAAEAAPLIKITIYLRFWPLRCVFLLPSEVHLDHTPIVQQKEKVVAIVPSSQGRNAKAIQRVSGTKLAIEFSLE